MCRTLDPLGFTGELEHLLLARGFDVVSQEIAIRKAKLDIDINYSNQGARGGVESYTISKSKCYSRSETRNELRYYEPRVLYTRHRGKLR